MAKQLDKDMMRMMSITERFNYIAAKKKMMLDISGSKHNINEPINGMLNEPWVDNEDDDDDYSSDRDSGSDGGDDSNEY